MELSINVGYFGPHISDDHDLLKKIDSLGYSCIWTAEAYGYDAVTPLAYFAAITENIQIRLRLVFVTIFNLSKTYLLKNTIFRWIMF